MDYESLAGNWNAANSNFHPAELMAPSAALHFCPFDPHDFSVKLYLSTKLRGKRAKMESRRRSHGHSRVEIRISCISVSCQTLVIHCIQFRVLLLNLWLNCTQIVYKNCLQKLSRKVVHKDWVLLLNLWLNCTHKFSKFSCKFLNPNFFLQFEL